VLASVPGGGLTHARAAIQTRWGIATAWVLSDRDMTVDVAVPPGSFGRFVLPPGDWRTELDGRAVATDLLPVNDAHGRPETGLESGRHRIVLTAAADSPASRRA
jgi:hypothetical protein